MVEVSYSDTLDMGLKVKGIMKTNDGNTIILKFFPKGRRISRGVNPPWWARHSKAEQVTSWEHWKDPG